jgi:hypothetical protein
MDNDRKQYVLALRDNARFWRKESRRHLSRYHAALSRGDQRGAVVRLRDYHEAQMYRAKCLLEAQFEIAHARFRAAKGQANATP